MLSTLLAPRRVLWLAGAGAFLSWSGNSWGADADAGGYVTPGFLYAPSPKVNRATGLGFEIGSAYYERCCSAWGALVQGEYLSADGARPHAYRGALGAQFNWGALGFDAGWAVRSSAAPVVPWATGPQVGAFFSLGVASVGVRILLPVSHGAGATDASEVGLVLTLKTVVLVYGESQSFLDGFFPNLGRMPSGRPLLVERVARIAGVVRAASWLLRGAAVDSSSLDAPPAPAERLSPSRRAASALAGRLLRAAGAP